MPNKKIVRFSAPARVQVTLEFTCPGCQKEQTVTLSGASPVGGCTGHGEGEYCYCDSPHYEEAVQCEACKAWIELQSGY